MVNKTSPSFISASALAVSDIPGWKTLAETPWLLNFLAMKVGEIVTAEFTCDPNMRSVFERFNGLDKADHVRRYEMLHVLLSVIRQRAQQ